MLHATCGDANPFGIDSFKLKFPYWSIRDGIIIPHPFVKILEFHSPSTAQNPLSCYPEKSFAYFMLK